MYCQNCGYQLDDKAHFCPECGHPTERNSSRDYTFETNHSSYKPRPDTKGNAGWAVLGFFIPLAGLILYLVWKDEKPGDSAQAGKGALIGLIISVFFGIISTVLGFLSIMIFPFWF